MQQRKIVIVDPICRESRLFYSWLVASVAIERGYVPVLITRANSRTESYHELFGEYQPELHEIVELPEDFWYGRVGYSGVKAIFKKLAECVSNHDVSLIYFAGMI